MVKCQSLLGFVCVFSILKLSFGGPLILSNGNLDKGAVESHILKLEETVSDLIAQVQVQEQKQAAVLSSLLSKMAVTTDELANLKIEFDDLEMKYNLSTTELSHVKDELSTLKSECVSFCADLGKVVTDLNRTSENLQQTNEEIANLHMQNNATELKVAGVKEDLNTAENNLLSNNENQLKLLQTNMTSAVSKGFSQRVMLNATIQNLQQAITDTESKFMESLRNVTSDIRLINLNISARLQSMNTSIQKDSNGNGMPLIAFSTALNKDRNLTDKPVVKFGHVILNSGDGYNTTTGIFTCPHSGIYSFQIHAVANWNSRMSLRLIHNNDIIVSLYTYEINLKQYDGNSNSAIFHVNKGDKISVQSQGTSSLKSNPKFWYTTFSGYLMASSSKDGA